jgi:hypothetical protein
VAGPLPTCPPSLKIRTVLPASAVPVKVGVVSVVTLSVLETPLSEAAARSGVEGGGGGVTSLFTVTVTPAEVVVLPAASRARAVRVYDPLLVAVVFQETEYGIVVSVPISVVPAKKSTATTPMLSEALALTGVASETVAPVAGSVTAAVGPAVSMVTLNAPDSAETLFAASTALAVILCVPLLSALVVML